MRAHCPGGRYFKNVLRVKMHSGQKVSCCVASVSPRCAKSPARPRDTVSPRGEKALRRVRVLPRSRPGLHRPGAETPLPAFQAPEFHYRFKKRHRRRAVTDRARWHRPRPHPRTWVFCAPSPSPRGAMGRPTPQGVPCRPTPRPTRRGTPRGPSQRRPLPTVERGSPSSGE